MNILHRQRPRKLSYAAGITLAIAAFATPGANVAAAQDCFFIFCQDRDRPGPFARPGWSPEPEWRRDPQWQREPESQREPGWQGPAPDPYRPREPGWQSGGQLSPSYSRIYAEADNEPFPVPAFRLSDVDPVYLRTSVS
jgi:hypothetical protein